MTSSTLHEGPEDLSCKTRELHRALVSLMEELEAVDWYGQRVDATSDDELKRVLDHNRSEEVEHACMTLEWIRRHDAKFDECLRNFLFRDGPIVGAGYGGNGGTPTLGIGTLRGEEEGR